MKKYLLVVITVLLIGNTWAQLTMNGTYSVGNSLTDFESLSELSDALNGADIIGDVTIEIVEGVYYENLILNNVDTKDFSLKITSSGEKDQTIIYPKNLVETIEGNLVGIQFKGVDRLSLEGLVVRTDSLNYLNVLDMGYAMSGEEKERVISVEDCNGFSMTSCDVYNEIEDLGYFTYYMASGVRVDAKSDVNIDSCYFSGAASNIRAYGEPHIGEITISNSRFKIGARSVNITYTSSSSVLVNNNVFDGDVPPSCEFVRVVGNTSSYPYDSSYVDNVEISNNDFFNHQSYGNAKCIYTQYCKNVSLIDNYIQGQYYALFASTIGYYHLDKNTIMSSTYRTIESAGIDTMVLTNNLILSHEGSHALENQYVYDVMIVANNTFYRQEKDDAIFNWAMYVSNFEGDSLIIANNLFLGGDTTTAPIYLNDFDIDMASPKCLIDYNAYAPLTENSQMLNVISLRNANINGVEVDSSFNTLSDWQSFQPYLDQNSISMNESNVLKTVPEDSSYDYFVGHADFHLVDGELYRKGIYLPFITEDIDGEPRTAFAGFDIGADQYFLHTDVDLLSCDHDLSVVVNSSHENIDSYRWYFGDGMDSDIEEPVHNYSIDGMYTVSLVVCETSGYCDSNSFEIEIEKTGCKGEIVSIEEFVSNTVSFHVYPNPTEGEFTIESQIEGEVEVSLTSINGVLVYSKSGHIAEINKSLNNLTDFISSGAYMLSVKHAGGLESKVLVIQ